jgi:dephospho-CoA kinase
MRSNKIVIGLTGMPGSGKSIVVEAAREFGYDIIIMGDVIREETAKCGLEPTPYNIGKVMLELRKKGGNGVIAEKCIPRIDQRNGLKIMIDGLRSYTEAEIFQKYYHNFILATVHSSPQTRFKRLSTRGRSDDPHNWEIFEERDKRELSVGIGNAIALSEYVIINENTMEELRKRTVNILNRAEERWNK